eukprot:scaffold4362_cov106-Isochrysis_galbana.AAC.1
MLPISDSGEIVRSGACPSSEYRRACESSLIIGDRGFELGEPVELPKSTVCSRDARELGEPVGLPKMSSSAAMRRSSFSNASTRSRVAAAMCPLHQSRKQKKTSGPTMSISSTMSVPRTTPQLAR